MTPSLFSVNLRFSGIGFRAHILKKAIRIEDTRSTLCGSNNLTDIDNEKILSSTSLRNKAEQFYIHKSSFLDVGATIGKGTKIWHFSHIQSDAVIGEYCSIGQNVNVANNVKIGNHVKIQNNVSIYEGVELEDYVFCS